MRVLTSLFCMIAFAAHSRAEDCDPQLFKDASVISLSKEETLDLLMVVNEKNFSEFRQNYSGSIKLPIKGVPVEFGSSYDTFDKKRRELLNINKQNYSSREARSAIENRFSERSTTAYIACLESQTGLMMRVMRTEGDLTSIKVRWRLSPGLTASSLRIILDVAGGTSTTREVELKPEVERIIRVRRNSSKESAHVIVRSSVGDRDIWIPKQREVVAVDSCSRFSGTAWSGKVHGKGNPNPNSVEHIGNVVFKFAPQSEYCGRSFDGGYAFRARIANASCDGGVLRFELREASDANNAKNCRLALAGEDKATGSCDTFTRTPDWPRFYSVDQVDTSEPCPK